MENMQQREAFWSVIVDAAKKDKDIIILSADSGSSAFDEFRRTHSSQWVHCGIAESNMACVAAGLALSGKKPFMFAIAPFITGRIYDQLKVAIALRRLNVCVVGIGAGYSYDDGGPTHYSLDDIGLMKNLKGITIVSPRSEATARLAAQDALDDLKFRYVRLDRHVLPELGASIISDEKISVITYGAMSDQAVKMAESFASMQVHPIVTVHPFSIGFATGGRIVVIEEHFYTGGLGESVAAWMKDRGDERPLLRCAIPDRALRSFHPCLWICSRQ